MSARRPFVGENVIYYYSSLLIHSGYKKRLLRDGKVLAREIS